MSLPENSRVSASPPAPAVSLSLRQLLVCSGFILTLSMGIRHGFGLWLQPMTMAHGWTREDFALAMAVQNLLWGIAGPVLGLLSDRLGAARVLALGAVMYALGLLGMANATSAWALTLTAGVLIGVAQSGTTYAVVYGVIGRNVPAERRSWAMGVTAAAGSFGQFAMLPVENLLIQQLGWQGALWLLSAAALLIAPVAWWMREPRQPQDVPNGLGSVFAGAGQALQSALSHQSYVLLTLGYFVCGFQVVFIGVHLPSYLKDHGYGADVATGALALIGLFNVIGTFAAGWLGQAVPKRFILSAIYSLRSVAIVLFLWAPLSTASIYLFSAAMGLLWLSTVPPTNALIAQMFGVRFMAMLGGVAFLSHQLGSFLGVWLGGWLYERQGNYDAVWALSIALGIASGLLNLPVREGPAPNAALKPA